MSAEFPLTLTIRALDKASGPLRAFTGKLNKITAPFRTFGKDFGDFSKAANLGGIVKGFQGVGSAVSGVGREAFALGGKLALMAGAAGLALFSIVHGAVEAGDKLGEMAQRVGVGVDFYASLGHAANLADVDQESFNSSMDTFNKRLGEAKAGGGPLLAFLGKVSPALAKQVKGAKSTEQGLSLMTDAFSKVTDSGKLAALSAATFGKGSLQMGQFMHQGSAAIQGQMGAYLALAGSQVAFAEGAGDLDNAMKDTEVAFLGLRSAAFGGLFPAFTLLSKAVTAFLVKNRDGLQKWATETGAAITKWIEGGGIERVVAGLKEFGEKAAWLFDKIGGLEGALVGAGLFMAGPLIMSVLGLIPAFISLGVAMAPLAIALTPFLVAAAPFLLLAGLIGGAGYLIFKSWEPIKAMFGGVSTAFSGLSDVINGIVTFDMGRVIDGWTKAIGGFKEALMPALQLLTMVPGGNMAINFLAGSGLLDKAMGTGAGFAGAVGADAARVDPKRVSSSAAVSVSFDNLPRGARVTQEKNSSQPVDLSLGYSMAGG